MFDTVQALFAGRADPKLQPAPDHLPDRLHPAAFRRHLPEGGWGRADPRQPARRDAGRDAPQVPQLPRFAPGIRPERLLRRGNRMRARASSASPSDVIDASVVGSRSRAAPRRTPSEATPLPRSAGSSSTSRSLSVKRRRSQTARRTISGGNWCRVSETGWEAPALSRLKPVCPCFARQCKQRHSRRAAQKCLSKPTTDRQHSFLWSAKMLCKEAEIYQDRQVYAPSSSSHVAVELDNRASTGGEWYLPRRSRREPSGACRTREVGAWPISAWLNSRQR